MKNLVLTLLGILILIIENSITNYFKIFGISINILLIYLVIISLYKDELEAGIIGAILGLIRDITVGGIFGTHALVMFAIAYVISFLRNKIYRESYITIFVLTFVASLIDSIINIMFFSQVYSKSNIVYCLMRGLIYIPVINSIFSTIFYFTFKKWILKLKRE